MSAPSRTPPADRRARLVARVLDLRPIRWLRPILDDYSAAGGGLLASGLAFDALFAALPAILLLVSVLGLLLGDPARVDQLIAALADRFPPLEAFFRLALAEFDAGAASFSVIGFVGLVWGSSRFYQSLEDAIARIFQGDPRRDRIQRGLRGVLSVLLLVGAVLAAGVLLQLAEEAGSGLPVVGRGSAIATSAIGSAAGTIALFAAAIAFIYRIVPTRTPSWRAVGPPAVAAGVAIGALTAAFALLAPRLIGSLRVYGAFVAVFAALIWLSWAAQALLIGAAWVHRRTMAPAGPRAEGS